MRLREAYRVPDPEHAHEVLGADIGAEDGACHAPPRDRAARQIEVLRAVLLTPRPEADPEDDQDAGNEDCDVERSERDGHRQRLAQDGDGYHQRPTSFHHAGPTVPQTSQFHRATASPTVHHCAKLA